MSDANAERPNVLDKVQSKVRCFFYPPDVAAPPASPQALAGVDIYLGDGATMTRSMVRTKSETVMATPPSRRSSRGANRPAFAARSSPTSHLMTANQPAPFGDALAGGSAGDGTARQKRGRVPAASKSVGREGIPDLVPERPTYAAFRLTADVRPLRGSVCSS